LLRHNQLWIHEWHGCNEYLLNRILKPGRIRFHFSIGENSYLYVIFHKTANGFSGLRLSRSSEFPAIYFQADSTGKFQFKQPLQMANIPAGWHKAELIFKDDSVSISFDSSVPQSFEQARPAQEVIGFRSGENLALLDNVQVYDPAGKLILSETFRNHQTLWLLLFVCGSASILLSGILIFRRPRKLALFKV